jgi:hypothetical protein
LYIRCQGDEGISQFRANADAQKARDGPSRYAFEVGRLSPEPPLTLFNASNMLAATRNLGMLGVRILRAEEQAHIHT